MKKPSLLVFVRHAESTRNAAKTGTFFTSDEQRKQVQGISDRETPLTARGLQQAEQTGRALQQRFGAFDALFHSGYQRTIETAAGLLRAYTPEERGALPQHTNLLIRERDTGYAFDMTQEESELHFPWLSNYWKTFGAFFAHPPGGESMAQVCQRVALFLDHLYRDLAGKKVLIVSHGGTIRAFRYWLEQWSYQEADAHFHSFAAPKNCAVISYVNQDDTLKLTEDGTIFY